MASQPTRRPWFRLSSMARPAGPGPAPAPPPAPVVQPTFRPVAPPAEPTPSPPATRAPNPPAPAPAPAAPTPTPPPAAAPSLAVQPPAAPASPPARGVTGTTASIPSSPARGINSAPSAASPPATAIAITSASSVPSSPGNKVAPSTTSGMPSPRNRVNTSVSNSPATSRAVPPPQNSPPKPTAPANSVPPQTYSPPKPRSTIISSASTAREPNPNYNPSPRTIKPANNTPPQSPNRTKPTAPPPSPLNLPPSQLRSSTADQTEQRIPLEAEQKTVLVQKTIDQKPNFWFGTSGSKQDHDSNRESQRPNHHAHHAKQEKINRKKLSSDTEEAQGMRVITIAGENKGAFMELIRSPNKHHQQRGEHSHYLYKKGNEGKPGQTVGKYESDKSYSSSSSGEEGKPKVNDKSHHKANKTWSSPQLPLSSFTNSNVQGINNSIVYNSSCTHHDPGVHLSLTRKPNGDGFDVKGHINGGHS